MIIIHGLLKIKKEYRAAFLEEAGRAVELSKAEAGNMEYRLFEAMDEPNTFLTIEKWKNEEAVESHKNSAHFIHFMQVAKEFLSEPIILDVHTIEEK
ncbi:putative quinol monooxygenase [Heyndrickxia camelliae]|uniref:Antibiotic biosynthesis monooxygenase n=1 Tax=Heyndrickxia camelliae TaxID=1707093 RepID=A0A2N3LIQ8_9BACI|nr:putative quinol monooxygenase [Heyndrickxia camelliae]PKR84464.1 antibiotic biosynthesis monooxygenase [Heyndrickxia camelliae]